MKNQLMQPNSNNVVKKRDFMEKKNNKFCYKRFEKIYFF